MEGERWKGRGGGLRWLHRHRHFFAVRVRVCELICCPWVSCGGLFLGGKAHLGGFLVAAHVNLEHISCPAHIFLLILSLQFHLWFLILFLEPNLLLQFIISINSILGL